MKPMKRRQGPHEVLARLVAQVGEREAGDERLGVPEVAAFLGIAPGTLYKHLDPDQAGDISYTRTRQITERYGVSAAAEDLAQAAGGVFVKLEHGPAGEGRWYRTLREIVDGLNTVVCDLTTALEDDGDVEREEVVALRMREHVARAVTDLIAHDLQLKQILDEDGASVVPMRRAVS